MCQCSEHVIHLRTHQRPEAGSASLAIVPHFPSVDWLATTLPSIRRALTADGHMVVRGGNQPTIQTEVRRIRTLHGFNSMGVSNTVGSGQVFNAELRAPRISRAA